MRKYSAKNTMSVRIALMFLMSLFTVLPLPYSVIRFKSVDCYPSSHSYGAICTSGSHTQVLSMTTGSVKVAGSITVTS